MTRFLLLSLVLAAACGDNIKPAPRPDARIYHPPTDPVIDPGTGPEPDGVFPGEDPAPLADAAVDAPACDDQGDTSCHMHNGRWHCDPSGHDHGGTWHQGHLEP
jgi:hypothetical protein